MISLNTQHPGIRSVVIMKNGKIIAEIPQKDVLLPQYSITKSMTSLAVGMLIAEGKLSLKSTVGDFFSVKAPLSGVTLEALLSMRSGLNNSLLFGDRQGLPDYLAACAALEVGERRFFYNNANAYLAGRMAEEAAGEPLSDLIVRCFFTPLGITEYAFEVDPQGHFFGASGLMLKTRDLAKIGNALLTDALQLSGWLQLALMPHAMSDEGKCYGYFFWMHPDYYYMSGKWGQRCAVIPKLNAVVAVNADMQEHDTVNTFIRDEIMPGLRSL